MRMRSLFRVIFVPSVLLIAIGQAEATPLVDFSKDDSAFVWFGNDLGCEGGCTLGYSFRISSTVSVDALGVYDADSNGLNNGHQVGLWDSRGTLLASTVVSPGATLSDASASGTGRYLYSGIGALNLGTGTYYVAALYLPGDTDPVVFGASGVFSNDSGATYNTGQYFQFSPILTFPSSTADPDRYFGAALHIASVPEPGVATLLALGMVGLGLGRRRLTR